MFIHLVLLYAHLLSDYLGFYHLSSPSITPVNCTIRWEDRGKMAVMSWPPEVKPARVAMMIYENYTLELPEKYPKDQFDKDSMQGLCFFHQQSRSLVLPSNDVGFYFTLACVSLIVAVVLSAALGTIIALVVNYMRPRRYQSRSLEEQQQLDSEDEEEEGGE